MKIDKELLIKILQAISGKSSSKPDNVFIIGYNYDPTVFEHINFLYENKYILAQIEKDEAGVIAQIYPTTLTSPGEKYLKQLLEKKQSNK